MNPFEDNENKTIKITGIKITLKKNRNNKVTEIEGWIDLTKEEFTLIKKTLNTGGSIKKVPSTSLVVEHASIAGGSMYNNIIKLQGDHVEFIKNKLLEKGVNEEIINIIK